MDPGKNRVWFRIQLSLLCHLLSETLASNIRPEQQGLLSSRHPCCGLFITLPCGNTSTVRFLPIACGAQVLGWLGTLCVLHQGQATRLESSVVYSRAVT